MKRMVDSIYTLKDGDGNLLEIIAHSYVKEDVLVPQSPLNILYVRGNWSSC